MTDSALRALSDAEKYVAEAEEFVSIAKSIAKANNEVYFEHTLAYLNCGSRFVREHAHNAAKDSQASLAMRFNEQPRVAESAAFKPCEERPEIARCDPWRFHHAHNEATVARIFRANLRTAFGVCFSPWLFTDLQNSDEFRNQLFSSFAISGWQNNCSKIFVIHYRLREVK